MILSTAESSIFLCFTFHIKRPTVSRKAFVNFKNELKRLTGRSWGVSMMYRYQKIQTYLQGWMNYFGIGMRYNDAVELDQCLRRRIRMCYWKQWRRTRKRVGELMKLGVGERPAVKAGMSKKAYPATQQKTLLREVDSYEYIVFLWHLAKTEAINVGLSNAYLKEQGLPSIRTLWIKIHHPATDR